jgi:hypothetical protein
MYMCVKVLMGDLNAEPNENAMQYLVKEESTQVGDAPSSNRYTAFKDAWLALHKEPTPGIMNI